RSADGSVGSPHARVGHCQASNKAESPELTFRAFCYAQNKSPDRIYCLEKYLFQRTLLIYISTYNAFEQENNQLNI
ncbi:hypothetical protein QK324_25070, partial [Serratia ureilytica]|uniref:hypothetical protein n=4 Tax=Serratia TaxID=613 RepID=UPI00249AC095